VQPSGTNGLGLGVSTVVSASYSCDRVWCIHQLLKMAFEFCYNNSVVVMETRCSTESHGIAVVLSVHVDILATVGPLTL
jgi:hypothetical protein